MNRGYARKFETKEENMKHRRAYTWAKTRVHNESRDTIRISPKATRATSVHPRLPTLVMRKT